MSLENTIAKYEVQIKRTGDGAQAAVADFKQLESAAAQTNVALQQLSKSGDLSQTSAALSKTAQAATASKASLAGLTVAGAGARAAMMDLRLVGTLVGMQTFPQLTIAASAASTTFSGLRAASLATGASLGVLGLGLAGLVGIIYTGVSAWDAYRAKQDEVKSRGEAFDSLLSNRERMLRSIAKLVEQDKLKSYSGDYYEQRLNSASGPEDLAAKLREVSSEIRHLIPTAEMEKGMDGLRKLLDDMVASTLEGFAKERFEAHRTYKERAAQLEDLAKKSGYDFFQTSHTKDKAEQEYRAKLANIAAREREQQAQEEARRLAEIQAENQARTAEQIKQFEAQINIETLQASGERIDIAEREYQARVEFYEALFMEGKLTEDMLVDYQQQALAKRLQAEQKYTRETTIQLMTIRDMQIAAAESFSYGLSAAIIDFADGTKRADEAFKEFASNFLKQISQMIMQQLILNAIKSAFFGEGGSAMSATPQAHGGITYAADGLAGISSVSSATYFPKFNVVAGEAGREMLTVLARPRRMEIGGMEAVVGQAGRNTLAITNAHALASGGGGGANGRVVIEIQHSESAEARIVNNSVQNAELRIVQRANQNSPLRDAIKRASS
jgi:hypothetical protein